MFTFYKNFSHLSPLLEEKVKLHSGITVSVSTTKIIVEMPMPCTESFYYKKTKNSLEITNDIRLIIEKNEELDSSGITSCLLLGAAVAPLSPYKNIHAFIPGYRYDINTNSYEISSQVYCHWSNPLGKDYTMDIDEQIQIIADLIDKKMREKCPTEDPLILFSGGVDSSVFAQRASKMGWDNTTLVHFSFGEKDPETEIAHKISSILKLPMEIINWHKNKGFQCLESAADQYRQIFCDLSTVPTYIFNQELMSKFSNTRTILEGIGADGSYATFSKVGSWQRLYRIPQPIIYAIGRLYNLLQLWKNPSKFEHQLRIFKRSSTLPKCTSIGAMNPMLNITYYATNEDIRTVSNSLQTWLESVSRSNDDLELLPLVNIAFTSAGNYIQKNKSPLNQNSFQIEYPFLDHEMLDLALQHARFWPGSKTPKRALKYLLSKSIPPELVYRKKQGFLAPLTEQFSNSVFLEHFELVSNPDSPLYNYVNQKILKQLLDYLVSGRELALQTYNSLWSITFTNSWLSQVEEVSIKMKQNYSKDI
jgi:asparagine synthase (glutamine-hydrolysing)